MLNLCQDGSYMFPLYILQVVAAFVTLIMRCKMEIAREWQGWPIATATQHPMPDLAIRPIFAVSNPAMEAEDDPGRSTSETSGSQFII